MVDTIGLILSKRDYVITDPEKFSPSAQWILSGIAASRSIQSKQNPTAKELRTGIYKPRLTLSQRINPFGQPTPVLKIELSLPKLLYSNNFQELKGKDFAALTATLSTVLECMGVKVSSRALAAAPVSAIHYSKNIPLTDGATPYYYINKLKEANVKQSLDVNQTDYRNDGHVYKYHCNSYEVVFYDKIKDLQKAQISSKRAIEKDSDLQLHLFDSLRKKGKLEILRMEVRLNKRSKIKQLFKLLNISASLTFKGLFKPSIAKKVLLHYLDEIESNRPALMNYKATNDKALLTDLIMNNPDCSPKNILMLFGLRRAFEFVQPGELRNMFAAYPKRSWYKLIADAQQVKLSSMPSPFKDLRNQLTKFKSIKFNLSYDSISEM